MDELPPLEKLSPLEEQLPLVDLFSLEDLLLLDDQLPLKLLLPGTTSAAEGGSLEGCFTPYDLHHLSIYLD